MGGETWKVTDWPNNADGDIYRNNLDFSNLGRIVPTSLTRFVKRNTVFTLIGKIGSSDEDAYLVRENGWRGNLYCRYRFSCGPPKELIKTCNDLGLKKYLKEISNDRRNKIT